MSLIERFKDNISRYEDTTKDSVDRWPNATRREFSLRDYQRFAEGQRLPDSHTDSEKGSMDRRPNATRRESFQGYIRPGASNSRSAPERQFSLPVIEENITVSPARSKKGLIKRTIKRVYGLIRGDKDSQKNNHSDPKINHSSKPEENRDDKISTKSDIYSGGISQIPPRMPSVSSVWSDDVRSLISTMPTVTRSNSPAKSDPSVTGRTPVSPDCSEISQVSYKNGYRDGTSETLTKIEPYLDRLETISQNLSDCCCCCCCCECEEEEECLPTVMRSQPPSPRVHVDYQPQELSILQALNNPSRLRNECPPSLELNPCENVPCIPLGIDRYIPFYGNRDNVVHGDDFFNISIPPI